MKSVTTVVRNDSETSTVSQIVRVLLSWQVNRGVYQIWRAQENGWEVKQPLQIPTKTNKQTFNEWLGLNPVSGNMRPPASLCLWDGVCRWWQIFLVLCQCSCLWLVLRTWDVFGCWPLPSSVFPAWESMLASQGPRSVIYPSTFPLILAFIESLFFHRSWLESALDLFHTDVYLFICFYPRCMFMYTIFANLYCFSFSAIYCKMSIKTLSEVKPNHSRWPPGG